MLGQKRPREQSPSTDAANNRKFVARGMVRWIRAVQAYEEAEKLSKAAEKVAKEAARAAVEAGKEFEKAQKKAFTELQHVKFHMNHYASEIQAKEMTDVIEDVAVFGSGSVLASMFVNIFEESEASKASEVSKTPDADKPASADTETNAPAE